ncbi:MAG: YtxH domain-containing protein [Bacteroidales bacterium]|nr:YtxH domain-containing protein [Bacteroidales bacterium]
MDTGKSLLCFIAGALTGAVAAVLLAPDSGANTRARIRQGASDIADKVKGKITGNLCSIERALEEE